MNALDEQKAEIQESETNTAMKQEPVNSISLDSIEDPIPNQNGTNGKDNAAIDHAKPVKTEAEASLTENSFISRSLQLTPTTISSPMSPFAPNLGSLSSQLTPDEQTAAYKKANIIALSTLAKKGGPNTKDMFAVQQKLQEFLTSLITLAGQKGPQLKVTVQMLVQNLVTGQISEEEFASRIESDLHSKHQPSLLPFLKDSVPHLKTRLHLQQAIMKEILQRTIAEKRGTNANASSNSPAPSSSSSPAVNTLNTSATRPLPSATVIPTGQPVVAVHARTVPPSLSTGGTNAASNVTVGGSNTSSGQSSIPRVGFDNLPKVLRDKIAKLPPDQQNFLYLRQAQLMKDKEQQLKQQQLGVASPKVVLEKQQQLIQEQQVPLVVGVTKPHPSLRSGTAGADQLKGKSNFATMRIIRGGTAANTRSPPPPPGRKGKGKGKDNGADVDDEEEVAGMDILAEVGVNLQEETFLPQGSVDTGTARSCKDVVFLNLPNLRQRVEAIMRVNGMQEMAREELLVLLSHATQERMRDVVEKLTEISQHRVQVLKDDSSYRVGSEVRGQLRVLENIDRIIHKRKQEKEHEQMLRAAKSRSKGADPEKAAKIREEAKQIQQDEATRIRNESANRTALAAIGRKRPLPEDSGGGSGPSSADGGTSSTMTSSLFAPLASTRAPKRHVTSRDLIFYMEQERESRKSLALYKALL